MLPLTPPAIIETVDATETSKPSFFLSDTLAQNIPQAGKTAQSIIIHDLFPENEQAKATHLVVQGRDSIAREFSLSANGEQEENQVEIPIEQISVVEVIADRQEYDEQEQVITAQGSVVMRFNQAVLTADRVQINLANRIAVAEGDVTLTRGEQVLQGSRFEYFFFQDSGVIFNASGEYYQTTLSRDTSLGLPTDINSGRISGQSPGDLLFQEQPLENITTAPGYNFTLGSTTRSGGQINRLRFQAERVDFDSEGWEAQNIRITNDPFSPPELEIRADTAKFSKLDEQSNELRTTNSRVVFDQRLSLPIFQDRLVFDRRPRQPGLVQLGYDSRDRGGLFIERNFTLVRNKRLEFSITPQYFIQRSLFPNLIDDPNADPDGGVISADVFGGKSRLDLDITRRTIFDVNASLTSLNFNDIENNLRAAVRFRQALGVLEKPYNLNLEYIYRDRLFNGSLGFQDVQRSVGAILTSPVIPLGATGINLSFQTSVQNIEADTDRQDLLEAERSNNRINLTRYQGAIALRKDFPLWRGKALPATATEGLRYSPRQIVPYLNLNTGITGVGSFYTSSDNQNSLSATVGIQGQLGHFSRNFFDYTAFNVGYTQVFLGDESPFLFDRVVDNQTLSFGLTQQIYGPFLLGFQTSLNLDTGKEISTNYSLEYNRRTYRIVLSYNPILQVGFLGIRISDFNWVGEPEPFDGTGIRPVTQGVKR